MIKMAKSGKSKILIANHPSKKTDGGKPLWSFCNSSSYISGGIFFVVTRKKSTVWTVVRSQLQA
ncbi:hypothetical protein T4E_8133 [Trichinella pseudospiralis]|uniref:Uncharacterized protein n=1 Tax=Trichinella pseudospiralis TaxID=6337 RepID=A0A0V0YB34_TRIPS|nr:hypothetical protein T4E_8133 [Trichinella pseudospiralis]